MESLETNFLAEPGEADPLADRTLTEQHTDDKNGIILRLSMEKTFEYEAVTSLDWNLELTGTRELWEWEDSVSQVSKVSKVLNFLLPQTIHHAELKVGNGGSGSNKASSHGDPSADTPFFLFTRKKQYPDGMEPAREGPNRHKTHVDLVPFPHSDTAHKQYGSK